MDQRMKAEPASPDQRVPSQSNTATRGDSAWTRTWKAAVVSRSGVGVMLCDKDDLRAVHRWLEDSGRWACVKDGCDSGMLTRSGGCEGYEFIVCSGVGGDGDDGGGDPCRIA
jgi:hypothetical protein